MWDMENSTIVTPSRIDLHNEENVMIFGREAVKVITFSPLWRKRIMRILIMKTK